MKINNNKLKEESDKISSFLGEDVSNIILTKEIKKEKEEMNEIDLLFEEKEANDVDTFVKSKERPEKVIQKFRENPFGSRKISNLLREKRVRKRGGQDSAAQKYKEDMEMKKKFNDPKVQESIILIYQDIYLMNI